MSSFPASSRVARRFLGSHPRESARILERLRSEQAAALLSEVGVERAAPVVTAFQPEGGARVIGAMAIEDAGKLLSSIAPERCAGLLRLLSQDTRKAYLDAMEGEPVRAVKKMLQFPPSTAGAMMDPRVVSFRESQSVGEALDEIRDHPDNVRFEVYVVDDENVLRGMVSLRDLMLKPRDSTLRSVMQTPVDSLPARAAARAILSHPAFRRVPMLPVVDEADRLVGVFPYETLQSLAASGPDGGEEASPLGLAMALSELFWIGASGLVRGLEKK